MTKSRVRIITRSMVISHKDRQIRLVCKKTGVRVMKINHIFVPNRKKSGIRMEATLGDLGLEQNLLKGRKKRSDPTQCTTLESV